MSRYICCIFSLLLNQVAFHFQLNNGRNASSEENQRSDSFKLDIKHSIPLIHHHVIMPMYQIELNSNVCCPLAGIQDRDHKTAENLLTRYEFTKQD